MSSGTPDPPYRLTMNDWTRENIRRLTYRAIAVGYGDRFVEIMV